MENAWQGEFNEKSLWWAVLSVSNTMDVKWCYMIKDVREAQKEVEDEIDAMMKTKSLDGEYSGNGLRQIFVFSEIEKQTPELCDSLTRRWFKLHYTLLGKYQNGYADWGYSKVRL